MKLIGDVLRETRLKRGLSLDDAAELSQLSPAYLLAMELNRFDGIEGNDGRPALEQYMEALEIDFDALDEQKKNSLEAEELVCEDIAAEETLFSSAFADQPTDESRLGRHQARREKTSQLPIILLTATAALILLFVSYMVATNLPKNTVEDFTEESTVQATVQSSAKQPVVEPQEVSLSVTAGENNQQTVGLKHAKNPVTVEVSLAGAVSAWFSVSGGDLEESGIILGEGYPSHTVTLNEDTVESVISLGSSEGVSVKVAGKDLDLSNLSVYEPSYTILTVEKGE